MASKVDELEAAANQLFERKAYYEASQIYQELVRLHPEEPRHRENWAVVLCNVGNSFLDARCWSLAIRHYEEARLVNPRYPHIYHNLGLAYGYLPDYPKAKEMFEISLRFQRDFGPTHLALGFVLFDEADFAKAEPHLRKYLELEPESENAPRVRELLARVKGKT